MNWGTTVRTAIVCAILIVLHFTLRPLLAWRAGIDFLVIALMFGAVRLRPGAAALFGFLLGLTADSLALSAFGANALAMTVVGFTASWLKAIFFADNLLLNGFFLLVGKWLFDLIFLIAERRLGGLELVMQLVVWSMLASAVTALAGVVALMVLRPLLEARTA
ncbi:MAG: rod shape-determining protein MreD [Gemmatimonadaceae bacterium]